MVYYLKQVKIQCSHEQRPDSFLLYLVVVINYNPRPMSSLLSSPLRPPCQLPLPTHNAVLISIHPTARQYFKVVWLGREVRKIVLTGYYFCKFSRGFAL